MLPVQFFLFGLFLAWFTGTGKLRALLEALRNAPPTSSGGDGTGEGNRIVPNPPESDSP